MTLYGNNNLPIILLILMILSFSKVGYSSSEVTINDSYIKEKYKDHLTCLRAIRFYEQKYNIPKNLLHAVTLVESGRWFKEIGIFLPHPWTLNVSGKPYYFSNKKEANAFLQKSINDGIKSIDVGCGQININFHGHFFEKIDNLLNPVYNIAYAAYFIFMNYAKTNNWYKAVALYHSSTPELGSNYLQKVIKTTKDIRNKQKQYDHIFNISITKHPTLVKRNINVISGNNLYHKPAITTTNLSQTFIKMSNEKNPFNPYTFIPEN